jgi:bifunctional N-acetylglutamate synthase/kinase
MELSTLIARLLENIGSRSEVDQYLRYYGSADPQKFAIVEVAGDVLAAALDSLVSSFTFLQRVGLLPIILLDAPVGVTRATVEADSLRLAEALEEAGTRARPLHGAVFQADRAGHATGVNTSAIVSAIKTKQLPIVAPIGETADGHLVLLDSRAVIGPLATTLVPHKIISLTTAGALHDKHGAAIPAVNLEEDLERVAGELADADRSTVEQLAQLLRTLPRTTSVSITSPDHVARELFTHRGAGTLIRLGERITAHDTFATIDRPRLAELIANSFGRPLASEYFANKQPHRIYLADSYRATAILTREHVELAGRSLDIAYLDKFAVTGEAQGEGIGASLWQRMRGETPALFWRARAHNPINSWYMRKADGMHKSGDWIVFWAGTQDFATIRACVDKALTLPASLAT